MGETLPAPLNYPLYIFLCIYIYIYYTYPPGRKDHNGSLKGYLGGSGTWLSFLHVDGAIRDGNEIGSAVCSLGLFQLSFILQHVVIPIPFLGCLLF